MEFSEAKEQRILEIASVFKEEKDRDPLFSGRLLRWYEKQINKAIDWAEVQDDKDLALEIAELVDAHRNDPQLKGTVDQISRSYQTGAPSAEGAEYTGREYRPMTEEESDRIMKNQELIKVGAADKSVGISQLEPKEEIGDAYYNKKGLGTITYESGKKETVIFNGDDYYTEDDLEFLSTSDITTLFEQFEGRAGYSLNDKEEYIFKMYGDAKSFYGGTDGQ